MNDYPVARGPRSGDPHLRLRLIAVVAGVVLVAAAAFTPSSAPQFNRLRSSPAPPGEMGAGGE